MGILTSTKATATGFVLLLSTLAFAEEAWIWQNPLPQGNKLSSIYISPGTAIAVGNFGTVVRSVDGGKSWLVVESGTRSDFRKVRFVEPGSGYAVASDSILRITGDGGETWIARPILDLSVLQCAFFLDKNRGYAFGKSFRKPTGEPVSIPQGRFLKTLDGGMTWAADTNGRNIDAEEMHFFNNDTGITIGKSGVYLTLNAGSTWAQAKNPPSASLIAIQFLSHELGFGVSEDGSVFTTVNGGDGWTRLGKASLTEAHAVHFTDSRNGYVAGRSGSDGVIFKTTDGGVTWESSQRGKGSLFALQFADGGTGFAVGGGGAILETADAGKTWAYRTRGYVGRLNKVWFVSVTIGFSVGENGIIFRTNNGGDRWDTTVTAGENNLIGLHFPDAATGYAVGDSGVVLKTGNGGQTWERLESGIKKRMRSVWFQNSNFGFAVGDQGLMLNTTDGGKSWASQDPGVTADLHSICFVDSKNGYASGTEGTVLKTTDGGLTWNPRNFPGNDLVGSLVFIHPDTGMAVLKSGVIRTSNGGTTWTYVEAGLDLGHGLSLQGSGTGFMVGRSGMILKTSDGGQTWTSQSSGTETEFISIHCPDAQTCYAVGEGATIKKLVLRPMNIFASGRKADKGSIGSLIGDELRYKLGESARVIASVFDLRGKAVVRLVDAVQGVGTHSLHLGSDVPKGIYLVELRAGQTREHFQFGRR